MPTHVAYIRTIVRVSFNDDGKSHLKDQAISELRSDLDQTVEEATVIEVAQIDEVGKETKLTEEEMT